MGRYIETGGNQALWLNKPIPIWAIIIVLLGFSLLAKKINRVQTNEGTWNMVGFFQIANQDGKILYVPVYTVTK